MPPGPQNYWKAIAVSWTCVAVALVVQALGTLPKEATTGFTVWVLAQQVARAVYWALLTPWIFRLRLRWSMKGPWRYAHFAAHGVLSLVAMAAFFLLRLPIYQVINGESVFAVRLDEIIGGFNTRTLIDIVIYWGVLVAGWMIEQQAERRRLELRQEQLRSALVQAELAALKQQLQPHFLFNSLNAISALMRDNEKDRAVDALAKLSGLMRTLMANASQQEVELTRELDYVQRYLEIEKLRFEERLVVRFDVDEECLSARVPTLLLQPLVENAIKHGLARRRLPGKIAVSARRHGVRLLLEVSNEPPENLPGRAPPAGQGLGLSTTRSRLQQAYGENFSLRWEFHPVNGGVVTLDLPWQTRNGEKDGNPSAP
jgi:hypothetical protein